MTCTITIYETKLVDFTRMVVYNTLEIVEEDKSYHYAPCRELVVAANQWADERMPLLRGCKTTRIPR
jgi:hypothetical protein